MALYALPVAALTVENTLPAFDNARELGASTLSSSTPRRAVGNRSRVRQPGLPNT